MSSESNEPRIQQVKLSEIQPGPIRHESLTADQLERTRIIYKCIGPYLQTTFEQFELNFLRDSNPEQEIQIWGCIAIAHQTFLSQEPDVSHEDADRAFKAFLMISMGAPRPEDIPESAWESLEAIYDGT